MKLHEYQSKDLLAHYGVPVPAGVRVDQWADVPAVSAGLPAARAAIHAHLERLLEEWRRP